MVKSELSEPRYLLDVNVLIALTNGEHTHHAIAHRWFSHVSNWSTTPITETAFVRLMLNPQVSGRTLTAATVLDALARLRELPGHAFLPDDSTATNPHLDWIGLIGHRQVTDFHLVNLAARHGWVLATFDTGIRSALTPADQIHCHIIS